MAQNIFFDELMQELETQSLSRFGLNIFNVNSYAAYIESSKLTTYMQKTVEQHGKNPNGFGQMFETYEVGLENIQNAYNNDKTRVFTTDELDEIRKLNNEKDFKFGDTIRANYSDKEINSISNNLKLDEYAKTNHTLVDAVGIDKNGNIVKKEQLKAISDSIFSKSYDKYFEAGVKVRVDEETYKRAEQEIEKSREKVNKQNKNQKENLYKLKVKEDKFKQLIKGQDRSNAGYSDKIDDKTGHTDGESALKESYIMQAKTAGVNVLETGFSDSYTAILNVFASGSVYELKDEFILKNHEDFSIRIERILKRVYEVGSDNFVRGASYGVIDTLMIIISQYLKAIGGNLKTIWTNLRNSAKSIYNAIYQFIKGQIKTYSELIRIILKSLFSAIIVGFGIALEQKLSIYVGNTLAIAISILICSVGVAIFVQSLDLAINGFLAICAKADVAKKRREEVEALFNEVMPKMIENRKSLEKYLDNYISNLSTKSDLCFNDLVTSLSSSNYKVANDNICKLGEIYGVKGLFKTNKEFIDFLDSDKPWC